MTTASRGIGNLNQGDCPLSAHYPRYSAHGPLHFEHCFEGIHVTSRVISMQVFGKSELSAGRERESD